MTSITNSLIDTGVRLSRFVPIPKHQTNFNQIMNGIGNVAKGAINSAQSLVGTSGGTSAVNSTYQEYLDRQIEHQEQMLTVSLSSNVEKVAHDTRMAAVRNIRAN